MEEYNYIQPTESNHFCLFSADLENDENVFFHVTLKENFDSILNTGFLPASQFKPDGQKVVSYAYRSTGCLSHRDMRFLFQIVVVFAVRFIDLNPEHVHKAPSEMYVKNAIQPNEIIGYCE
ncbi:MAG: hypothetical protein COA36_17765 [Desulfotalea sp.]|nr:MAG: hypothetical protein COA36_17765 [Desulfotalea sp.]